MKKRRLDELTETINAENDTISGLQDSTYMSKNIAASDIISQLKSFLDENFRGAYVDESITDCQRYAVIYPYQFAFFLTIIFRSVWGKDIIRIRSFVKDDKLIIEIALNTSILTEDELLRLESVANKGNFNMSASDEKIEIIHSLHDDDSLAVCEKKITFVYNILCSTFELFDFL